MEKRPLVFYSHLAIILHLLFDLHLCAQLPGWKFTPRFPEKRVSAEKQCQLEVSNSMRYLVHLRPRQDQPLSSTDVPAFHTFLRQLMQRKKIRLIPKMEQLVPGCGPHLIRLEVTMMTLVADLSPHHFLTIFKAMQTWPEYHGSPLKQVLTSGAVSMAVDDSTDQGAHKDGTDSSAPPAPVTERC
ncbi:dimethyladenosine transferase 2, mitochondrial-like [Babylonia areolata]